MTTAISIEDIRREVKILKALSGQKHLVRFYDACENANNAYIVMEYVSPYPPIISLTSFGYYYFKAILIFLPCGLRLLIFLLSCRLCEGGELLGKILSK